FEKPVGSFIADGTEAASIEYTAANRRHIPIEAELAGGSGAVARMIEIIAESDAPIEIVEPLGLGPIYGRVAIWQIPAERLEAEAGTEIQAVVRQKFGWRHSAGCRRQGVGAAMEIFDARDEWFS